MRRLAFTAIAFALALCALAATVVAQQASAPPYVVIVHPGNQHGLVRRQFLADAYFKKITRWSDGKAIYPADLPYDSAARQEFSERVMRRSASAVRAYWQQRIFAGVDVPPPQFKRDEDVVSYVLSHEGAIGYVSWTAELRGAKAVPVGE
jgi:ABC-type phosphate transport system substrate-binding protein